jgi:hypothetical protein
MAMARMVMIAAGYEDCDDVDALRSDPALKIAVGRAPDVSLRQKPPCGRGALAPSPRPKCEHGDPVTTLGTQCLPILVGKG